MERSPHGASPGSARSQVHRNVRLYGSPFDQAQPRTHQGVSRMSTAELVIFHIHSIPISMVAPLIPNDASMN